MKAAVYHGIGAMRVEECQEPRIGAGDTVAVVGAGPSGILHAELARAAGRFSASASSRDNALIAAIPRSVFAGGVFLVDLCYNDENDKRDAIQKRVRNENLRMGCGGCSGTGTVCAAVGQM